MFAHDVGIWAKRYENIQSLEQCIDSMCSPVLQRNISTKLIANVPSTHFDKPDGSRLFTETLPTKVKTVFADETSLVGTETARQND